MNKIKVLIVGLSLSLNACASTKEELVGCWEGTLKEAADNRATICFNHQIGNISYYYTNKNNDAEPTRCFQHAFVEYEADSILLEGVGGYCENERRQAKLTFRCITSNESEMSCEMYVEHTKFKARKIEKSNGIIK